MLMEHCSHCIAYAYKLSHSLVLTSASYRQFIYFINALPEAICCFYKLVMLVFMDCMCIPTFIVVTALVVT